MKDFSNLTHRTPKQLNKNREKLGSVYAKLPKTTGCMENINAEGGCGAWCCLTPDVLVYTSAGPVRISEVVAGDEVLTKGGWRKVVRTGSRYVNEQIVRLKTCYGREITLTSNHEVYVEVVARRDRHETAEPMFVEAGDIVAKTSETSRSSGHYVVFPKVRWEHRRQADPCIDLCNYVDGLSIHHSGVPGSLDTMQRVFASARGKGASLPRFIRLDAQWLRIIGLFLAEGSYGDSQVEFHFDIDETDLQQEVYAFASRLGLLATSRVTHGRSLTVRVFSRLLKRLFQRLCGEYCHGKRACPQVMEAASHDFELAKALHDGLYAGDGGKKSLVKGVYSYTTTSPELASQIVYLNHLLGRMVGVSHTSSGTKRDSWSLYNDQSSKHKDYIETDLDFRVPVRSATREEYAGLVYDIEVEGEHSFFTESGEVHNCQTQNPQVLEVEFANSWHWVNQSLSREETIALIARALKNYLSNKASKGCIFFDYDSKTCLQHQTRPYACRIYGIMPEEEWRPRYEKLKVLNNNAREQCNLVKTEDGQPFTKAQSDAFWKSMVDIEAGDGIPHRRINDKQGGTYRTFHDHLIQFLYGSQPQVMRELAKMRLNATQEKKDQFVANVIGRLLQQGAQTKPEGKPSEPSQGAGEGEGGACPVQPE